MIFREATIGDIPQIQIIRNAVKENTLSDPHLITDDHCKEFITQRGKGWVCVIDDKIVGFSIVDIQTNNVWALFVHPNYEKIGIGKSLHQAMLNWYFDQTNKNIWLSTSPHTRAEIFYKKMGWVEIGIHGKSEIKFEMTYEKWKSRF